MMVLHSVVAPMSCWESLQRYWVKGAAVEKLCEDCWGFFIWHLCICRRPRSHADGNKRRAAAGNSRAALIKLRKCGGSIHIRRCCTCFCWNCSPWRSLSYFFPPSEKSTSSNKNPPKPPVISMPPKAPADNPITHFGVVIHDRGRSVFGGGALVCQSDMLQQRLALFLHCKNPNICLISSRNVSFPAIKIRHNTRNSFLHIFHL